VFGLLLSRLIYNCLLHCSLKSGLSHKLAQRKLLQWLQVTLWKYNAEMVLRHYALHSEDSLDYD